MVLIVVSLLNWFHSPQRTRDMVGVLHVVTVGFLIGYDGIPFGFLPLRLNFTQLGKDA